MRINQILIERRNFLDLLEIVEERVVINDYSEIPTLFARLFDYELYSYFRPSIQLAAEEVLKEVNGRLSLLNSVLRAVDIRLQGLRDAKGQVMTGINNHPSLQRSVQLAARKFHLMSNLTFLKIGSIVRSHPGDLFEMEKFRSLKNLVVEFKIELDAVKSSTFVEIEKMLNTKESIAATTEKTEINLMRKKAKSNFESAEINVILFLEFLREEDHRFYPLFNKTRKRVVDLCSLLKDEIPQVITLIDPLQVEGGLRGISSKLAKECKTLIKNGDLSGGLALLLKFRPDDSLLCSLYGEMKSLKQERLHGTITLEQYNTMNNRIRLSLLGYIKV